MRDLFLDDRKNPAVDWQEARDGVQVFKFYAGHLLDDHPESFPNTYRSLADVNAIGKIVRWGKAIAIEVPAVKGFSCDSAFGVAFGAIGLVDRVVSQGGRVTYLALDEPFLAGVYECHLTEARTASLVADFVRIVRAWHPDVRIGLIEPYPTFSVDRIARFLERLDERGARMAFLHADVDMNAVRQLPPDAGVDPVHDLRALHALARGRRMPFGFIVWGLTGESDRAYFDSALTEGVGTLKQVFGEWEEMPDHLVFQSWVRDASGRARVPYNLPARTPYTHTFLLEYGLRCLKGIGPCGNFGTP
jgi:hypothetical protein